MKSKLFLTGLFIGILNVLVFGQTDTIKTENLLEMSFEDLLNMDVTTASKSAEKQSEAPGIISVLTKDELERFGGTTLRDILERVPGLTGFSQYMTDRSMISARGDQVKLTSSHILFLINGRPVREILEGGISSELLETYPVNIIERIEVIKGPGSVLYGSDAFSAVINIITENAEKTGGSISGLAGNEGALGASGDIKIKAGDFNLVVAGNYLKKPELKTDYTFSTATDTITRSIAIPDKGYGTYLGASYKNFSLMASANQWNNQYFSPHRASLGVATWTKTFGNLGYDGNITKKWRTNVNLTYTQSKFEVDTVPYPRRNSNEIVAEWANFFDLGEKSKLVIGGLFNNVSGKEKNWFTDAKQSDSTRSAYGFFAQVDYRIFKSLKLIGGFQINKTQNVDMGFVPRAGIIWYPIERINIKALYSEAFRAPSINELSVSASSIVGNPTLKPEKVKTIDIGISYQGEQAQIGLNYFHSKQIDIIYRQSRPAPLKAIYSNLGEVTFDGIEFEGKLYVNKSLYLNGSVLYQVNKDSSGNTNVTPIANLSTKAGISYAWDKGVTISLFDIYQGPISDRIVDATVYNPKPEPYNLLNLYCNFAINKLLNITSKAKFAVFVQVDNLLDEKIWIPVWGLTNGWTMPYDLGRSIYFGVTASLN